MTARDKYSQVATLVMGDAVKVIVKKATTRIPDGPKKKHLNILVNYANRPDSEITHLCKCILNRIKKNHKMIAFKSLVLLNYLLVSCKRPELYRVISSISSVLTGPCFVDPTAEGAELTKRFLKYIDFVNEKAHFFKQLGYNLDSAPKKELQEIVENSPEHIIQELNYGIICMDTIFKQDIDFSPFLTKPVLLGNVVLVKDLIRIYNCLKKRLSQINENKNLFPQEAVAKSPEYQARIEEITKKLDVIYTQVLDMNIQSVVKLIEATRENRVEANPSLASQPTYPTKTVEYVQSTPSYQTNQQPPEYQSAFMPATPQQMLPDVGVAQANNTTKQDSEQVAPSSGGNLLDLDDIFGSKTGASGNSLNDIFLEMGTQSRQNQQQPFDNPQMEHKSPFEEYSQQVPLKSDSLFSDNPFGKHQVEASRGMYEQNQQTTSIDILAQEPPKNTNPFDINLMIQKNLDFTTKNNNVFTQRQATSNVVPAQGMTGYFNSYQQPYQQPQAMQYQGFGQQTPMAHPNIQQQMASQYNPYQLNGSTFPVDQNYRQQS